MEFVCPSGKLHPENQSVVADVASFRPCSVYLSICLLMGTHPAEMGPGPGPTLMSTNHQNAPTILPGGGAKARQVGRYYLVLSHCMHLNCIRCKRFYGTTACQKAASIKLLTRGLPFAMWGRVIVSILWLYHYGLQVVILQTRHCCDVRVNAW